MTTENNTVEMNSIEALREAALKAQQALKDAELAEAQAKREAEENARAEARKKEVENRERIIRETCNSIHSQIFDRLTRNDACKKRLAELKVDVTMIQDENMKCRLNFSSVELADESNDFSFKNEKIYRLGDDTPFSTSRFYKASDYVCERLIFRDDNSFDESKRISRLKAGGYNIPAATDFVLECVSRYINALSKKASRNINSMFIAKMKAELKNASVLEVSRHTPCGRTLQNITASAGNVFLNIRNSVSHADAEKLLRFAEENNIKLSYY